MDFKLAVRSQDNTKTYNLDLYGDVDINVIFSINDIRNPESIKSNYTKQFTIPATHNNNKFFESLLYNGNYPTSFNPNFKASAQLYGDSTIIIDGYLQVTEIIKNDDNNVDSYNVVIYGEISSLFNDLGGLRVTDLDFSEYNHIWNFLNVKNSWNTSIKYNNIDAPFVLGRGYVYPFEWRGQTTNEMGVEDFYPAIYVKTIFDKIFKKAGKTYTSKFLNSKEFKSLVIPFSKQHIYLTEEQKKAAEFLVSQSVDTTLVNAAGKAVVMYPTVATTSGNINVTYNTETSDPSNLLSSGVFTASKKQFTNLGANVKVKIGYQGSVGSGGTWKVIGNPMTCNVWLYNITTKKIVGSEIISIDNPSGTLLGPGPFYSSGECFVDYTGIIEAGHQFRVILNFTVPVGTTASKFANTAGQAIGGTITPYIVGGTDFYNAIQENWLFEGDAIQMNQIVPDDLDITDLLTSINKMFNLYWLPDGDSNFIIEPRDVLYTNPDTQILDWTKKTNRNTDITITPLAELNNNKYIFTYSEGDDYYNSTYDIEYNEVYGSKIVEVLNDFVSDKKEIKPKFQASVMVRMNSSQRIAPAYVIQQEGFFESTEPKLRILYYGGLITTSDFFLFKSKENKAGLMQYNYPYAGHFNNPDNPTYDINFGQSKQYYYNGATKTTGNLFNNYWANSINDIIAPDSHIWSGELHLTPFDIITMNLFDTIQMDQVFYKINKIDYNPLNELAKVELVKTTSFLTKPNVTTVKPEVIGGGGGGYTPWNPVTPWTPRPWVIDKTWEVEYSPIKNPQWTWQQGTEYNQYRTAYVTDRGSMGVNTTLIEANNKNFTTTKYESSIHRNNFEAVNFIDVKGTDNYVAPAAYAVRVTGNDNQVMAARNISIVGNNNTVEQGISNVTIVGDNVVARESNVSYIDGIKIKNGAISEEFNYINGSVNEIQNPFASSVNANLIRNGKDAVQNIGGMSKLNYVNGGANATLSPTELF
jgi:hypothetical protein